MKKYIQFIRKVQNRFDSPKDYFEFQRFQAQWILNDLTQDVDLCEKIVLDLGSGPKEYCGYTIELAKNCKIVYAVDLNMSEKISHKSSIISLQGDASKLPFKNNSFDFVFCSSLIEHIPDQKKVIHEINRILKNGEFCYLSFPPFYSPVGGHQFKPFHLLGEKMALILFRLFKRIDAKDFKTSFGNWGLYPTKIYHIKKLVKMFNFKIVKIRTRFSPVNVSKIPILSEFLTWHVEFLLQKRGE